MRRIITGLTALTLLFAACTFTEEPAVTKVPGPGDATTLIPARIGSGSGGRVNGVLASRSLHVFEQCGDFLSYVKEHAVELVGPYGLPGLFGHGGPVVLEDFAVAAPGGEVPASSFGEESSRALEFSTTNVQEVGVDEPDIVKTDGRRIIALAQQRLYVVDIEGGNPVLVGDLDLSRMSVRDMFLSGDTALVMGTSFGGGFPRPIPFEEEVFAPDAYYPAETSMLAEIDLAGDDPKVVRTMEMDGRYLNARMIDDTVRIVSTSGPSGLAWAYPEGGGLRAEREAVLENIEIIENSTIDNWVPYYVLSDREGSVISEGNLVDCDRAHHPKEFAGFNLLTVSTIDMSDGLRIVDSTGVLAAGETVYASTDSLYVATGRWTPWWTFETELEAADAIDEMTTDVHKFDISNPDRTEYIATGRVDGFLLNQFAMSEHNGDLRVASTTTPDWWGWGERDSESLVTVLRPDEGGLKEIGRIDGLGKGEQIFSVRFAGDIGYVVTFRQTDPLYTIDLSDPSRPLAVGELKILGYSAYLHPVGDDLLIGVGQDATDQGRTLGTQVSVFDVADLADPRRIGQFTLDDGSSAVEYDHRAFLYWEETGLAMVPVQQWAWEERTEKEDVFFGAIGIEISDEGIREIARVTHPGGVSDDGTWDWQAQINRSLVVGDGVYTVSAKGVLKSDLDSLDREIWVPFAA